MSDTKLRFKINSRSLARAITLLSNTAVLATNGYLLGRSVIDSYRDSKRERVLENLEVISQTLGSLASLSNVILNVLDKNADGQ